MNHRTKTFWLPALISLVAAMALLMISTQIALQPRVLAEPVVTLRTSTTSYSFAAYLPWLILLPFCGAAGAYLSRRAGGQPALRLVAGLFPVVVLFGLVTVLALWPDCAISASMVGFRDSAAISNGATEYRAFFGSNAVLERTQAASSC